MLSGVINTNVNALYALNSLTNTTNTTSTLEQELSSGLSINSPADNPAGYIAAQGFTAQLGGVTQATSNANQAISLVQTADGAITQQVNILQNILTIASQAANGGATSQQLASLQQVVSQLQTQVSSISTQTNFNGVNLLDGTFQGVNFQVGADAGQTIGLTHRATPRPTRSALTSQSVTRARSTPRPARAPAASATTPAIPTRSPARPAPARSPRAPSACPVRPATRAFTDHRQRVGARRRRRRSTAITSKTNVTATADTSVAFTVTAGSFSFTLGNGTGAAQTNAADDLRRR